MWTVFAHSYHSAENHNSANAAVHTTLNHCLIGNFYNFTIAKCNASVALPSLPPAALQSTIKVTALYSTFTFPSLL